MDMVINFFLHRYASLLLLLLVMAPLFFKLAIFHLDYCCEMAAQLDSNGQDKTRRD